MRLILLLSLLPMLVTAQIKGEFISTDYSHRYIKLRNKKFKYMPIVQYQLTCGPLKGYYNIIGDTLILFTSNTKRKTTSNYQMTNRIDLNNDSTEILFVKPKDYNGAIHLITINDNQYFVNDFRNFLDTLKVTTQKKESYIIQVIGYEYQYPFVEIQHEAGMNTIIVDVPMVTDEAYKCYLYKRKIVYRNDSLFELHNINTQTIFTRSKDKY